MRREATERSSNPAGRRSWYSACRRSAPGSWSCIAGRGAGRPGAERPASDRGVASVKRDGSGFACEARIVPTRLVDRCAPALTEAGSDDTPGGLPIVEGRRFVGAGAARDDPPLPISVSISNRSRGPLCPEKSHGRRTSRSVASSTGAPIPRIRPTWPETTSRGSGSPASRLVGPPPGRPPRLPSLCVRARSAGSDWAPPPTRRRWRFGRRALPAHWTLASRIRTLRPSEPQPGADRSPVRPTQRPWDTGPSFADELDAGPSGDSSHILPSAGSTPSVVATDRPSS